MNILDIAVLVIMALFILGGLYKGFLSTVLGIAAFIVSWLIGLAFMPLTAGAVKGSEKLYTMMLYYTEGSEFIGDVELSKTAVAELSSVQLRDAVANAALPYPMGKEVTRNIAREAFSAQGVTTLGEYFNQTIVCVFINILVFIAIFALARLVLAAVINGLDHTITFPVLHRGDELFAMGAGLLRGIFALFLIFMLLPIVLTALGQFDFITDIVEGSFFASFFYKSNFLLSMMPGT